MTDRLRRGALGWKPCVRPATTDMRSTRRWLAAAALLVCSAAPSIAEAQSLDRIRLGATLGLGQMLSSDQTGWLGFGDPSIGGGLTAGYQLIGPLVIDTRFMVQKFPAIMGDGTVGWAGVGARLDVQSPIDWLRFGPSAYVSVAKTGDLYLPSLGLGVRIGVAVGDQFTVGPELSLERIFYEDGPRRSTDPEIFTASVSVTWRPPVPQPMVVDRVVRTRVEQHTRTRTEFVHDPPPPPSAELEQELGRLLDQALPITRREERRLIPPVLFEFDSTTMLPCGEVALHVALDAISNLDGEVLIEGHADGTGENDYNLDLSLRRAERVRDWLVAHGVPAEKLRVEAHGEDQPLEASDGETVEGASPAVQTLDRRVVFRVISVNVGGDATPRVTEEPFLPAMTCPAPSEGGQ